MLVAREIHPLADFLRNRKRHVARVRATKSPEVLTVNSHAEIVMVDAESYHDLADRLHHMETFIPPLIMSVRPHRKPLTDG